jgi:hypothetical protein
MDKITDIANEILKEVYSIYRRDGCCNMKDLKRFQECDKGDGLININLDDENAILYLEKKNFIEMSGNPRFGQADLRITVHGIEKIEKLNNDFD